MQVHRGPACAEGSRAAHEAQLQQQLLLLRLLLLRSLLRLLLLR